MPGADTNRTRQSSLGVEG